MELTYNIGDVMRPADFAKDYAFADAVITKIDQRNSNSDNILYTLSRPYLYASHFGNPLVGYETIGHVRRETLDKHWVRIAKERVL